MRKSSTHSFRSPALRCTPPSQRRAFSLIELLVVLAVLSMILALALPALAAARLRARLARVHADLRSIDQALAFYLQDHNNQLPPTRASCSSRIAYELPVELALGGYLPMGTNPAGFPAPRMPDPFRDDGQSYLYRAPGPAIFNESTLLENGSMLWVPQDFPLCQSDLGRYFDNTRDSPARYAIWSIGPDPNSPRFARQPARIPLPRQFWFQPDGVSGGVITHFQDRFGNVYSSP